MSSLSDEILEHLKADWPEAYEKWSQDRAELAAERERADELDRAWIASNLELTKALEHVAKLREALEPLVDYPDYVVQRRARAALKETGDDNGL